MGDKKRTQVSVTIDGALAAWLEAEAETRLVGKAYLVEAALRMLKASLPDPDGVVDVEIVDG